jgi:tetratricopeptide (TPR) repeat protein
MYEFDELEKKWLTYKKNKYKKVSTTVAAFAFVAAASALTTYLLVSPSKISNTTAEQPQQIVAKVDKNETAAVLQAAQTMVTPKEIVIISPNEDKTEQFKSFEQKQEQPQPVQQIVQKKEEPKVAPKIFMETKNTGIIETLQERYDKNPNLPTALAISIEYYKTKDYQKALNWAINANALDSKNEKSWILFAKASYKLGKKTDAVNALENFVKTSPSDNAKATLNQIKNNEL